MHKCKPFFRFLQAERCVILHSDQQHISDAAHRVQLVLNVNLPRSPFKCVFEHRKATFKICQQILFHICLGDCTLTPDTAALTQSVTEHTERVWHNTILIPFPYGAPVKHSHKYMQYKNYLKYIRAVTVEMIITA